MIEITHETALDVEGAVKEAKSLMVKWSSVVVRMNLTEISASRGALEEDIRSILERLWTTAEETGYQRAQETVGEWNRP